MARDTRLLIARAAALCVWLACVIFVLFPRDTAHATPFPGAQMPQPRLLPARGL